MISFHTLSRKLGQVQDLAAEVGPKLFRNFDLKNPKYKVIANSRGLYHELGHRHLVVECGSVSYARGVLWRGLVQTARKSGVFTVFL
jgi:hypothetical protein